MSSKNRKNRHEVERYEAPKARGFEHEHPHDERSRIALYPAAGERDREQDRGHEDQEQRDPVHSEVPPDTELTRPGVVAHHLKSAVAGMEAHGDGYRERQRGEHARRRR